MLDDPVLRMYEAQAMLIEKDQILQEQKAELDQARKEIEKLKLANEEHKIQQAVSTAERNFEEKLIELRQNFEELRRDERERVDQSIERVQRVLNAKCIEIEQLKIDNAVTMTKLTSISKQLESISSGQSQYSSVMILGGWQDKAIDSICIYNSKRGIWQNCELTLPVNLANHGAAILNNEIYVFGGRNGSPNEPLRHCYKLGGDGEWIKLPEMNEKKNFISKISITFGSAIWVIGGWNGKDILKTVEKFDPEMNSWIKMPSMNQARSNAAASIINGKIYVSGGWDGTNLLKTIEFYDPAKNKWEIFCDMPAELSNHCSLVEGSNLIIIGGWDSNSRATNQIWKLDILDPKKEWKEMPSLRQKRYNHGAIKLPTGIMVFGGAVDKTRRLVDIEVFEDQIWTEGSRMNEQRGEIVFIPLSHKEEELFLRRFRTNLVNKS